MANNDGSYAEEVGKVPNHHQRTFNPAASGGSWEEVNKGHNPLIANPTYQYHQTEEKLHGFLSQQFPTIANPAPLGLCAFAFTTFVLSLYNTGALGEYVALNPGAQGVVLGPAIFYGGLCQLLAGMWEFKTGNTFGALAFSSYGGFWLSYGALFITAFGFLDGYTNEADLHNCLGVYLTAWGIFTFFMAISCHRTTLVLIGLFGSLCLTFVLLAVSQFRGGDMLTQRGGGVCGMISATIAWYAAFAGLLTRKNSLFTLPVGDLDPMWRRWGILTDEYEHRDRNNTDSTGKSSVPPGQL